MPDYFSGGGPWTDETVRAWVAGLFERAGRITTRTRTGRVTISATSRDADALRAAAARFKAGEVVSHHAVEGLYVWRVDRSEHAKAVLLALLPFLTTKAAEAVAALGQTERVHAAQSARRRRDHEIVAAIFAGRTQAAVAREFDVTAATVANAVRRWEREYATPIEPSREAGR